MRLVCSPVVSSSDAAALSSAVQDRHRWRRREDLNSIGRRVPQRGGWPDLLAWGVANDLISIRIAFRDTPGSAIYHEKIGVFADSEGNRVAFSGSANESRSGLHLNFERLDVFRGWGDGDEKARASAIQRQFRDLWNDDTSGLRVLDLHEVILQDRLEIREDAPDAADGAVRASTKRLTGTAPSAVPAELLLRAPGISLFEHQSTAIDAWAGAGGRGILEMATGSGKTITALSLASRLYDGVGAPLLVLVVAPLIHLVDQWCEVAARFGLRPIRCAEGASRWRDELDSAIFALNSRRRPILSVATTSATLSSRTFQATLSRIRSRILVIADEVHNYGSSATIGSFPQAAQFRLGLSATPDRWMDSIGTSRIRGYFGEPVFSYSLKDALDDEVLCRYSYHPVLVELHDEEAATYEELTAALARYLRHGGDPEEVGSDAAKRLLIKRARLVASAASKIPRLVELMKERVRDRHILVYCGDGNVSDDDTGELLRQVEAAVQEIGVGLRMQVASYTARTPPVERQRILREFADGRIQVLVAIRCLDEGVDVPETRTAFILASSTNPRQFIQRRGRVLRRSPGKSRAVIYDFFVVPPDAEGESSRALTRSLLARQIHRAREFANLASNGPVARHELMLLSQRVGLLSEWEDTDVTE